MLHRDGTIWWEATVGELARLGIQRTQLDPERYPLTAPHLRATPEQIADAERRLGITLDDQYRSLLGTGNGWPSMILDADLLSTDELGQGPLWDAAWERLDILREDGPADLLPPRDELLPILVSEYQEDVMLLWLGGPVTDGSHPVLWYANELIDEWPTVYDWMLGMTALLELRVGKLRAAADGLTTARGVQPASPPGSRQIP